MSRAERYEIEVGKRANEYLIYENKERAGSDDNSLFHGLRTRSVYEGRNKHRLRIVVTRKKRGLCLVALRLYVCLAPFEIKNTRWYV